MPSPTMLLPTDQQAKLMQFIQTRIDHETAQLTTLQQRGITDFEQWLLAKRYASLSREDVHKNGLLAHYTFEKQSLKSTINPNDVGYTTLTANDKHPPQWTAGHAGGGLKRDGDAWLALGKVGIFSKSEPFSVGLWVNIPASLNEGVIFHKSLAERLYNFRGYHLYMKEDGKLEVSLAHVAPSNAITRISRQAVPRNRWIHLTMPYDGSGRANGVRLFLDGNLLKHCICWLLSFPAWRREKLSHLFLPIQR